MMGKLEWTLEHFRMCLCCGEVAEWFRGPVSFLKRVGMIKGQCQDAVGSCFSFCDTAQSVC